MMEADLELAQLEINNSCILDLRSFTTDDLAVWNKFPQAYRSFLMNYNGGSVNSDRANFATRVGRLHEGTVYDNATNAVEEFWCFLSYENSEPTEDGPGSILHEHFNRHVEEEFLPSGVYAIGRCIQSSLICLSTNQADYGAVYYWEWYWQYPWYKDFFERRVDDVLVAYPDVKAILDDSSNPHYQEIVDAFNYATIVKISDTFDAFINSLFEETE